MLEIKKINEQNINQRRKEKSLTEVNDALIAFMILYLFFYEQFKLQVETNYFCFFLFLLFILIAL